MISISFGDPLVNPKAKQGGKIQTQLTFPISSTSGPLGPSWDVMGSHVCATTAAGYRLESPKYLHSHHKPWGLCSLPRVAHPTQLYSLVYLTKLIWSRALLPPQPYRQGQVFLLHPKCLFLLF